MNPCKVLFWVNKKAKNSNAGNINGPTLPHRAFGETFFGNNENKFSNQKNKKAFPLTSGSNGKHIYGNCENKKAFQVTPGGNGKRIYGNRENKKAFRLTSGGNVKHKNGNAGKKFRCAKSKPGNKGLFSCRSGMLLTTSSQVIARVVPVYTFNKASTISVHSSSRLRRQ